MNKKQYKECMQILRELEELRKSLAVGKIEESYIIYDVIKYYYSKIDNMVKEGN
jgi:hypothetical protein